MPSAMLAAEKKRRAQLHALGLAVKAEGFAKFLRQDGAENLHPNPSDYEELAAAIRSLCPPN